MPRPTQKLNVSSLSVSHKLNVAEVDFSTKSTITQGTSLTAGVTIDTSAGIVFTHTSGSLATLGSLSFTVSNSLVQSDSIVLSSIVSSPTGGIPVISTHSITTGSFAVNLKNADAVLPISGRVKIAYVIV